MEDIEYTIFPSFNLRQDNYPLKFYLMVARADDEVNLSL